MMSYKNGVEDAAYFRERLNYDPETGIFTWKFHKYSKRIGAIAGCIGGGGYRELKLDGVRYKAHRVAWLMMTGKWPEAEIDHINGDTSDNKFINLRPATHSQNAKNRKLNVNNKVGLKGVSAHGRGYRAAIQVNGKQMKSTVFGTVEEAYAAYVELASKYHGQFVREGL